MPPKTLIFDDSVEGHHLEYIHHIYLHCVSLNDRLFVFILPYDFELVSTKLHWPKCDNIIIHLISKNELTKLESSSIYSSFFRTLYLRNAIRKYDCTNVFLISLMSFMPFLPFLINRRVKISGIVYLIYLYRWYDSKWHIRFGDILKYIIFSQSKVFKRIFLLNDSIAPVYLNRKFKTNVFKYLPDPFMSVPNVEFKNLRTEIGITDDKIVCLHFGALTERKGTIEILKAIKAADSDVMHKCCFIFAGKIYADIEELFYSLATEVNKKTQIIIYNEFCDYDFIASLCLSSDFLLMPYKVASQSSGVLAYGARFGVPVVGPGFGLIGKLIKRHNLGITLDNTSAREIEIFFNSIETTKYVVATSYIRDKTVADFVEKIFEK